MQVLIGWCLLVTVIGIFISYVVSMDSWLKEGIIVSLFIDILSIAVFIMCGGK